MAKLLKRTLKRFLRPGAVTKLRGTRDRFTVKVQSVLRDPNQFRRPGVSLECPICGYLGRFWTFGTPPRPGAMCPSCMSLERHRLLQILFDRHLPGSLDQGRVLHFAPEPFIRARFEKAGNYVATDLSGFDVHLAASMERLPFPNASFQAVIANHVLEHVPDDLRALKELHRVTHAGGVVILSVPQVQGWGRTYEDSEIVDPQERRMHFGQEDHQRLYGRDFKRRVVRAGFRVESYQAGYKNEVRYGLTRGEVIYLCRPSEDRPG